LEYTREEKYWIWLYSIDGVGVKNFGKLLAHYGSASSVYDNAKNEELNNVVGQSLASKIKENANVRYAQSRISELDKKGITAICQINEYYPNLLSKIYDPPVMIFATGILEVLKNDNTIAMVGTRKCTDYGKRSALTLSKELSDAGIIVVSGMANGIDSFAHRGCLDGKSPTIAVLGCGVDIIYPSSNNLLYKRIKENGVIISEYWPGVKPSQTTFPARNRIISGISKGVVVIEAPQKSGALITVDFALDQGRDVFATPGSIASLASSGTNKLIQEGAKLVLTADDILSEYGIVQDKKKDNKRSIEIDTQNLSEEEINILQALGTAEFSYSELFEAVSEISQINAGTFGAGLTMLELQGIIIQLPGNIYTLNVK